MDNVDKSVNKSTSCEISRWPNVENLSLLDHCCCRPECLINWGTPLYFWRNGGGNHLFDEKVNQMFAKLAVMSDNLTEGSKRHRMYMITVMLHTDRSNWQDQVQASVMTVPAGTVKVHCRDSKNRRKTND